MLGEYPIPSMTQQLDQEMLRILDNTISLEEVGSVRHTMLVSIRKDILERLANIKD